MVFYMSPSLTIKHFDNYVYVQVNDCQAAAADATVMQSELSKVIECVSLLSLQFDQNEIILIFDLQRSTNMSFYMSWTLLKWLRETQPFLGRVLDFTHVVGPSGLWARILKTMQQFLTPIRPVLIDELDSRILTMFETLNE